jgi:ABC-type transport system involved in multi-copper enzyme maturation permease subunit
MTFLPIVERELRVAARRKATYWSRLLAAVAAVVIFGAVIGIFELASGRIGFGAQVGPILFGIFSWLSFAFVATAGIFLTADALSDEKREGTLGLLFLTDLRGYDVVLGKLLSNSLAATYGLLAAFPVVGISFLLGGVTGGEFGRLVLVLFNTLFFSLAAGMLVSAFSREAQSAMTRTALVGFLFMAVFPAVDWIGASWDRAKFEPWFSLASPAFTFSQSGSARLGTFWSSLAATHLLGWCFLIVACVAAPRTWQETAAVPARGTQSWAHWRQFGSSSRRAALRLRWLAVNPVRWLAGRDLWARRFQWIALAGTGLLVALLFFTTSDWQARLSLGQGAVGLLTMLVVLWMASQASRFFVDAMRSGTIELLLATPLAPTEIVRGQLWALRRTFFWPVVLLVLANLVTSVGQLELMQQNLARNNSSLSFEMVIHLVTSAIDSMVCLVTGLIAMAWFGMWMGLTSKKVNVAVIKTVLFVQVIPFVALMFLNFALMIGLNFVLTGGSWYWLAQPILTVLAVGVDVMFMVMARRNLLTRFRELATRASGVASAVKPPPLPVTSPGANSAAQDSGS